MWQNQSLFTSSADADTPTNLTASGNPRLPQTRRACDVCRRMKVKCDGGHPCKHCRLTFNDCLFSEPQRRKKRAALRKTSESDRIEHLEKRLKAVEESYQGGVMRLAAPTPPFHMESIEREDAGTENPREDSAPSNANRHGRTPGNQGEARFQSSAAQLDFLQLLKNELGSWPGADFEKRLVSNPLVPTLFPLEYNPRQPVSLPPQERAQYLIDVAFNAHFLLNFLHRPTFDSVVEWLFSLDITDYHEEVSKYRPLLFAVMAVGCISDITGEENREMLLSEGTNYFTTCRGLVDLLDCNDLVTFQTILYMNIFLLRSARLSSCYSYLSHTFSLALRMKLYQPLETDSISTRELKNQAFWTSRHLLRCVAIICGLPMPIAGDELDLEYHIVEGEPGIGVSETITDHDHIMGKWNPTIASIASFRLYDILGHVIQRLYPSKGTRRSQSQGPLRHLVNIETVRKLEGELQSWLASLPSDCILGKQKHASHIEKAKYDLCMSYAYAQILLYRPFLHYLTPLPAEGTAVDDGFPAYASACVDASRNILRLAQDMYNRGLFRGVHWDAGNMVLGSSLTMLYIILAWKGSKIAEMALAELCNARNMLSLLEPYTLLAKRTSFALKLLTASIIPINPRKTSPSAAAADPSTQMFRESDDSYTAALAEKTFRLVSKTSPQSDTQEESTLQTPSISTANDKSPPYKSRDTYSQRPSPQYPAVWGQGSINIHPQSSEFSTNQTSDPPITSLPTLAGSDMLNPSGPLLSTSVPDDDLFRSMFPQDYQMNGDFYGYFTDETGPIDFSDMIGDLFTSGGVL